MEGWRNGLQLLARQPNVAIKISDLVAYDHDWTLDSLQAGCDALHRLLRHRSRDVRQRLSGRRPARDFDEVYGSFKTIVSDLSPEEQRALFHDTAERLYRL